jgi:hypothetical protein
MAEDTPPNDPQPKDVHLDDATMARARADFASLSALASYNTTVERWLIAADGAELPIITVGKNQATIEHRSKVFTVSPDMGLAFREMAARYPERVGMTKLIGPHPKMKFEKLPPELKAIIDTNHDGSRLIL